MASILEGFRGVIGIIFNGFVITSGVIPTGREGAVGDVTFILGASGVAGGYTLTSAI